MGIVTGQVIDPGGNAQPGVLVHVSILTTDGTPAEGPGGNSIIIPIETASDTSGNWSVSLIPNDQITPSASVYTVQEGQTTPYYIIVPEGAGPFTTASIRTAAPTAPTSGAITAANVRVASGWGGSATNVQGAVAELFTDIGSGGAGVEQTAHKGAANGYAGLDGTTHVPVALLPTIPATDISVSAISGVTATNVQAAIAELKSDIGSGGSGVEVTAHKDAANGYPSLDSSSKVPLAELPVIPASDISVSAITGITGTTVQTVLAELYGDIGTGGGGATGPAGPGVPAGGTTGQILAKTSNTDFATNWENAPTGGGGALPVGGTTGQVLTKNSPTSGDAGWQTPSATTAGVSVYPFFVIAPGDSWVAALAAHPTMTTFIIKAGIHQNASLSLALGTNDHLRFIAEPGAIVDGGMVKRTISGVSVTNGSPTLSDGSSVFTSADVSGTVPTTVWGLQYQNNIGAVITAQAGTTATVDDNANGTVSGVTVTLTRAPAAGIDHFLDGTANDIWLKNLEIRNYATIRNRAAIHPQLGDDITQLGLKWRVEDCSIHDNANEGGRICDAAKYVRCHVYNNGDMGLGGVGKSAEIDDCEVNNNNAFNNPVGFDASGMKFSQTLSLNVHDNLVHDNGNNGIWVDVDCFNSKINDNIVWGNSGCGIIVETSYRSVISGNAVWSNGVVPSTGNPFFGGGNILISASSEIEVCYNRVGKTGTTNQFMGIIVLQQDRPKFNTSRSVTDMVFTNGSATVTSVSGKFRTSDAGAYINTSGLTNFTTFLSWNPIAGVWQLTSDGITPKVWSGSTVTQSASINPGIDNWGNTTQGQSNLRQRCYNISVHHNWVQVEAPAYAECFAGDTTTSAQTYVANNVRFWSNYLDVDPTAFIFGLDNGNRNLAYWHAHGMDTWSLIATATPNTQGNWLPPLESVMPPGDFIGIQNSIHLTKAPPAAPWTASTAFPIGSQIRPASPNGFLYQCTATSGGGGSPGVVQHPSNFGFSGALPVTMSSAPVLGNVLCAWADSENTMTLPTDDGTGGVWTLQTSSVSQNAGYFWTKQVASGDTTITTVTFNQVAGSLAAGVIEVTGVVSPAFDVAAAGTAEAAGSFTSTSSVGVTTTGANGDFVIAAAMLQHNGIGTYVAAGSPTFSNGFTILDDVQEFVGGTHPEEAIIATLVQGTAGAIATVASWTVAWANVLSLMIAFKTVSVGSTTTGSSAPTFGTTIGGTTTDGGITWRNLGIDPSCISGAAVIDLSAGLVQTLFLSANVSGWTVANPPEMLNAEVEITFANGTTAFTLGAASGSNISHDAGTSPAAPTASHRRTTQYRWDGSVLRQRAPSVLT